MTRTPAIPDTADEPKAPTPDDGAVETKLHMSASDLLAADRLLYEPDAEDCERFASRYGRALMNDRCTLINQLAEARAERDVLHKALQRLGSVEAFTTAGFIDKSPGPELRARIDYARSIVPLGAWR